MKSAFHTTTALLALAAAGCAQPTTQRPTVTTAAATAEGLEQQKLVAQQELAMTARLLRVQYRIATAAADLCGTRTTLATGFNLTNTGVVRPAARPGYQALFPDLDERPLVVTIVPGSAAEAAGLKVGDKLVSIDGNEIAPGPRAVQGLAPRFRGVKQPTITLGVLRGGETVAVPVTREPACDFPAAIQQNNQLNAFADGKAIYVTSAMMKFVTSDEELALVLGHELAHDFRGHIAAKKKNAAAGQVVGSILDVLLAAATRTQPGSAFGNAGASAGAGAYSVSFESEADYVGLYVMARAGYAIDDAPNFWRRMAVESPGSITMASSHPATAERFVALGEAIKEIKAKQAANLALVPNETTEAKKTPGPPTTPAALKAE